MLSRGDFKFGPSFITEAALPEGRNINLKHRIFAGYENKTCFRLVTYYKKRG